MGPGPLVTPGSAASALVLPGSRDTSKPAAVDAVQWKLSNAPLTFHNRQADKQQPISLLTD